MTQYDIAKCCTRIDIKCSQRNLQNDTYDEILKKRESIIVALATRIEVCHYFSSFLWLVSEPLSKTPKTGFLAPRPNYKWTVFYRIRNPKRRNT